MWIGVLGYSTVWGAGLFKAYDDFNLTFLDQCMTGLLGALAPCVGYLAWNCYFAIRDTLKEDFDKVKVLL